MITNQQLETILGKNLQNITKKLKDGKTLTAAEIKILSQSKTNLSENDKKEFAQNITELAEILGVPRKTIYEWRRRPGSPGTEKGKIPISEWIQFAESRQSRGSESKSQSDLNQEKIQAQIDNLVIKNQKMLSELIDRKTVIRFLESMGEVLRKVISQSGLDRHSQDKIYEQMETESQRVLRGLEENDSNELQETDEAEAE
jgi:hypothetical protein